MLPTDQGRTSGVTSSSKITVHARKGYKLSLENLPIIQMFFTVKKSAKTCNFGIDP